MFGQLKSILKNMSSDNELFDITASIYFNMHSALIKAGFNEEQALKIVCSHSVLPSGGGTRSVSQVKSAVGE